MPYEITNSNRGPSIVRGVSAGSYTVSLNDLRTNPTNEVVTGASIKRITWSTNGSIDIVRNGVPILALHGAGDMRFDEYGHSIANNSNQSIVATITTGGSFVMEVSKTATYNVAPDTGQTI